MGRVDQPRHVLPRLVTHGLRGAALGVGGARVAEDVQGVDGGLASLLAQRGGAVVVQVDLGEGEESRLTESVDTVHRAPPLLLLYL